jgi:hypothetical protein
MAPSFFASALLQRERPMVAGPAKLGHASPQSAPRFAALALASFAALALTMPPENGHFFDYKTGHGP